MGFWAATALAQDAEETPIVLIPSAVLVQVARLWAIRDAAKAAESHAPLRRFGRPHQVLSFGETIPELLG